MHLPRRQAALAAAPLRRLPRLLRLILEVSWGKEKNAHMMHHRGVTHTSHVVHATTRLLVCGAARVCAAVDTSLHDVLTCRRSTLSWRSVRATSAASPLSSTACAWGQHQQGVVCATALGGVQQHRWMLLNRGQLARPAPLPHVMHMQARGASVHHRTVSSAAPFPPLHPLLASSASDSCCARWAAVSACTTTWMAVCCESTPSSWST